MFPLLYLFLPTMRKKEKEIRLSCIFYVLAEKKWLKKKRRMKKIAFYLLFFMKKQLLATNFSPIFNVFF